MKRMMLAALIAPLLGSVGPVRAATPVYSLTYTGNGTWKVEGEYRQPGPNCWLPGHDHGIMVETGPAAKPIIKPVNVPIFFPEQGKSCATHYPLQYQPPFSFVAVMAPSKGVPGVLNLGILDLVVSEDGVAIERTTSDIAKDGPSLFEFYPWDFRFTPRSYDMPDIVIVVGTAQKDGKLRMDVRDGARGAWISTIIDGGWPIWEKQNNVYKPAMPDYWSVNLRGFPATLSYFAVYKEPLMETKRWDGKGPPTVNYMSADLYNVIRTWSVVDRDNVEPQHKYLPCNTGHWLPERADKKKVGPIPPGVRLCEVAP